MKGIEKWAKEWAVKVPHTETSSECYLAGMRDMRKRCANFLTELNSSNKPLALLVSSIGNGEVCEHIFPITVAICAKCGLPKEECT